MNEMYRGVNGLHWRGRVLLPVLLVVLMFGLASRAEALGYTPPSEPVLQFELGMHNKKIKRMALDEAGKVLVTGSDDKTIRVWDAPSGELRKTLRVPFDLMQDGRLYSVAITPDARTVAAAGWTKAGTRLHSIYLFDLETGEISARLLDLPNVIHHLAFSRDGRYLAACIGRDNGIRVYERKVEEKDDQDKNQDKEKKQREKWSLVFADKDYAGSTFWAEFGHDGRLVTSSYDSYVRLYDKEFKLIAKQNWPDVGENPLVVSFSPDGSMIGVGFDKSPDLAIVSAKDLSILHRPDTKAADNGNFAKVGWSPSGKYFYAGGRYDDGTGVNPVRRWEVGKWDGFREFGTSNNTIIQILPMVDDSVFFIASDGSWGRLDEQGLMSMYQGQQCAQFRNNLEGFRLSETADRVMFAFEENGLRPAVFDLTNHSLRMLGQGEEVEGLLPPKTDSDYFVVSGWKHSYLPQFNEHPIPVTDYEKIRSMAIYPDDSGFVLGTEFYLRNYDQRGIERWHRSMHGIVWSTNISGDGKTIVVALSGGVIEWYRADDGEWLFSLFLHKDGERWVLASPEGIVASSSPEAEKLLIAVKNRGQDQSPELIPVQRARR